MRAFAAFAMAAAVALVGCSAQPKATLPTYEQAAAHPFLQANRDAMAKLLAGLPAAQAL